MKQISKKNITWNSNWDPILAKPNAKVSSYSNDLQIGENSRTFIISPEINLKLGKDWLINYFIDSINYIKESINNRLYNPDGITVEHFSIALTKGAKFANELILQGYNINKQDSSGNTIFMLACQNFKRDWIDFLLDAGADVNILNNENENSLMYICKNSSFEIKGKIPISEQMTEQESLKLKEHNQSRKDLAFDTFNTLINVGADFNAKSKNGFTCLAYAVRRGNTDIVQRVIELGCKTDISNKEGATPLDIAIENGYITTSQLLFQLDENQLTTLKKIKSQYPSNPKFVRFFEILYNSNLEEEIYNKRQSQLTQKEYQKYNFFNKKM